MITRLLLSLITATMLFSWGCTHLKEASVTDKNQNEKHHFSSEITKDDLLRDIGFLASDSLKGRKPGMAEEFIAAGYIRDRFRNAGLSLLGEQGFQTFSLVADILPGDSNFLEVQGYMASLRQDFIPLSFSANATLEAPVIFGGYGFDLDLDSLKWNDYTGLDVKGKWVMILRGDPEPENPTSLFLSYSQERTKVLTAKDKGAAGVIFVSPTDLEKTDALMQIQFDKTPSDAGLPVIQITRALADRMLASMNYQVADLETSMKSNRKPVGLNLPVFMNATTDLVRKRVTTQNVVASIKGSDPVLSNEYIVIGAHYDHLGFGGQNSGSRVPDELAVHNGADDNASGTSGLLELAEKLRSESAGLKRSIVFIAFGGEEMGLLGSKEFIKNPLIDLKQIKSMINMDMIGRLNADSKTISVGGTGTSTESDTLIAQLSLNRPFKVNRSPDGYGPSDHAPFYSENIPVFYFTTGAHEDYHTPADDASKINFKATAEILDMIHDLVQNLASRQEPLVFREAGAKQGVRYGRNMKVTLGIVPDMVSSDNKGLRVDGTRKGGPAEKAGIRKGDVIIGIDGQAVTNIYDYMARLTKLNPGQVSSVELIRDKKKEVVIVQF